MQDRALKPPEHVPSLPVVTAIAEDDVAASESYARRPESAGLARRLVHNVLGTWGLSDLIDRAGLVATELVSNAVRHARGEGLRVTIILLPQGRVQVSVWDRDCTQPEIRMPSPDGISGRGLLLVDALSVFWGVELLPGGKRVWAVLEPEAEAGAA
jgi:anti-sigma regulatory factor (Ser/Thr protein kinase)